MKVTPEAVEAAAKIILQWPDSQLEQYLTECKRYAVAPRMWENAKDQATAALEAAWPHFLDALIADDASIGWLLSRLALFGDMGENAPENIVKHWLEEQKGSDDDQ